MNRKHIALLCYTFYGAGAPRMMVLFAGAFAARGYRVDLLVCRPHGHLANRVPESARLVGLEAGRRLPMQLRASARDILRDPGLLWSLVSYHHARYLPAVVRYLREARPDALLGAATYSNSLAVFARRLSGVDTRLVLAQQNDLSAQIARPLKRWKLHLVRAVYPDAEAVVAPSDGVAEDLARTAGIRRDRITTIFNPVDLAEVAAGAREPADHPWLGGDGPPVILGVGRLKPRKDFATLIRALRRVRERREARLIILGEGVERPRLEQLAAELGVADAVDLPGFTANPYAYYANATVFALCSRWEGMAMVLPEALACGCPVVSSDCRSGPDEVLEHGKHGALVPVGDDAAFAEAILATLEKPPPRAELQRRAADFGLDRIAERYLKLLVA